MTKKNAPTISDELPAEQAAKFDELARSATLAILPLVLNRRQSITRTDAGHVEPAQVRADIRDAIAIGNEVADMLVHGPGIHYPEE